MMGSQAGASDAKAIEDACLKTSHQYFIAVDAGDKDAFGALFADDAVLDLPGMSFSGRNEIDGFIDARPASRKTMHHMTSAVISPDEDGASGVVYALIHAEEAIEGGEEGQVSRALVSGIYHDRYVVEDGVCKFKARRLEISLLHQL